MSSGVIHLYIYIYCYLFFFKFYSHLGYYRILRIPYAIQLFVSYLFCLFLLNFCLYCSSVQFSLSVVSDSLRLHGLQQTRPPCPSSTPGVYSNSFPLSRWCHPTVSSSVIPFSSRLQTFSASGSFPMSQLFESGGQSIGVSASASVLSINVQSFLQDGLVGSPCSPRDSQESSPAPQFRSINSLLLGFLYSPTLTSIHDYWKNHSFD